MSDPFSQFDPEVPVAVPAAEIRRRGDRLRRRNTALAAVAGAVAVAAVVTPVAVLTGGGDSARGQEVPVATESGSTSAPTTDPTSTPSSPETGAADLPFIPGGFPLADGLPDTNDDDGSAVTVTDTPAVSSIEQCGETLWTPQQPSAAVDVAGAEWRAEAEGSVGRTLAVYPEPQEASDAMTAIVDGLEACPEDLVGGTGQVYELISSSVTGSPDAAAVFTHRYRNDYGFDTGLEVIQLVRVGPALYLSSSYGEGGGSPASIQGSIARADQESEPVVAAMTDVFSEGAGTSAPGEEGPVALTDQDVLGLDDLPAVPDYADDWQAADDDAPTWVCRPQGFADLGASDSVAASYVSLASQEQVPTVRLRTTVLQFADPDASRAAATDLTDTLGSCASDQDLGVDGDLITGASDFEGLAMQGFVYAAPETCVDCDAAWFDYQGVVTSGDRLIVVSYARVGGPLRPEGIRQTAQQVLVDALNAAGL